jgi:ATP/maltotriose-dependent transcriptional regulator MalT
MRAERVLGEALVVQGRLEEAEHYALLCREGAPQDDVEAQALWRQVLARVLAEKGDLDQGCRLAAEAVARAELTDALSWHASLPLNQAEVLS